MHQQSDELEAMRLQIAQGLLEHEIVVRALWAQALVSAMFILVLGSLAFSLWKRNAVLFEFSVGEIRRHSSERIALVKQHSLEQSSLQMQMLHAFEGIVSRRRPASANSPVSSTSQGQRQAQSTGTPTPPPIPAMPPPAPPPTPISKRRTPQQ